jgi:hypothetical protein
MSAVASLLIPGHQLFPANSTGKIIINYEGDIFPQEISRP